jgi:type I restriction enzyme R subunit
VEFINLIVDDLVERGLMDPALLYQSPFTEFTPRGPEGLFSPAQLSDLVTTLHEIRRRAAA